MKKKQTFVSRIKNKEGVPTQGPYEEAQAMEAKKRKRQSILVISLVIVAVLIVIAIVSLLVYFKDHGYQMDLSVDNTEEITIEYGQGFTEPACTAVAKGLIFDRDGVKVDVKIKDDVDTEKIGDYQVVYSAKYKDAKSKAKCMVHVVDTQNPTITLAGEETIQLEAGQEYAEPGFAASDNYDGDITSQVTVEGTVTMNATEPQILTYRIKDSSGNEASVSRTVVYVDTTAPSLALSGRSLMYIPQGSAYAEPGYSATDSMDGDLTSQVSVSGGVDSSTPGAYTISYAVSDAAGNATTVYRTVRVYRPYNSTGGDPSNKVIYLTFDDGPGPYTAQLLDVLDKYGVKVTFFVTNQNPNYAYMIGEEARRGHTVGLHTYSHQYAQVYSSVDSYFADLNAINELVHQQTGSYSNIIRFPGGSSNSTSAKYCSGIMSALTCEVQDRGFLYFDWNVSSQDAGGTTSTAQVVANVTKGCASHNVSCVLQHDIKSFSVDAVEEIIQWGLSEGYTFLPLSSSSPTIHQGVNN